MPDGVFPARSGPKGREASAPAVPPFLRAPGPSRSGASLGCLFRGDHPPGPTCRTGRRSSASRSRARSGAVRSSRASTLPGSLSRQSAVLFPFVAGNHPGQRAGRTVVCRLCDCSRQSADRSAYWRPSARRTGPTCWPPERRAGGSLPTAPDRQTHHITPVITFGHTEMLGISRSPEIVMLSCNAWPAGENTVKTPGQRMNANQTHP